MSARDGAVSVLDKHARELADGGVARGIIARAEARGFVREATIGDYSPYDVLDAVAALQFERGYVWCFERRAMVPSAYRCGCCVGC